MKKLLVLCLVCLLLIGTASAEVITTGSVHLRAQPRKDGDDVTTVKTDTLLEYNGLYEMDDRGIVWLGVDHKGNDCWVSTKYAHLIDTETGAIELSLYYGAELTETAKSLGFTSCTHEDGELEYSYSADNAAALRGNDTVLAFSVSEPGYSLYGLYIGMPVDEARELLDISGLTRFTDNTDEDGTIIIYEFEGDEDNEFGGCLNVYCTDGVVADMSLSTYTG